MENNTFYCVKDEKCLSCKYVNPSPIDHDWCKSCNSFDNFCETEKSINARKELKERRERIATKLMAGLLSNPAIIDCFGTCNLIAKEALEQTNALIRKLDEVKK